MTQEEYKKILKMAIDNEVEAYDFYKGVSEKTKDPTQKMLFSQLAEEERGHEKLLAGYLCADAKTFHFDESVDYKITESVEMPKLSLTMKPADAIALAMKKEQEAMKMYTTFANLSIDQDQKKIFQELANMEKGHKTKLENLYVDVAYPEEW